MVDINKIHLICMNCGFELKDISTYWLKQQKDFACPACSGTNNWKKVQMVIRDKAIERVREKETWKKLLIAQNKSKFDRGKWKLTKNWKAYNDWMEEMADENKRNKAKIKALKALNYFVDKDGTNKMVKNSMKD